MEEKYEIKENLKEENLDNTKISKPFLAYSSNGSISSSRIYYVNYCDVDDFELILSYNIDLNNTIVLCRYGKLFRGDKV